MPTPPIPPEDETAISEISIAADGRLYVFGASREVLDVLAAVNDRDAALRQRIEHLDSAGWGVFPVPGSIAAGTQATSLAIESLESDSHCE